MTPIALRPLFLALSIALLPAAAAAAGNGLYLDIPAIPGESTDPGHLGQIDVGGMSWGVSRPILRLPGAGPELGKLNVQDIAWMQGLDASTLPLFSSNTSGQPLRTARFDVVKPTSVDHAPSLSLTVERAFVSSLSMGGSSGNPAVVAVSVNPSVVSLSYDPSALGGTGPLLTTRHDLVTALTTGPSGRPPVDVTGAVPAKAGIYLRLGSGATAIAGDSQAIGYENWIAIDSFSMGASITMGADGKLRSTPSVSELSWVQTLDGTAPVVLFDLLKGQGIGQATIEKVALDRQGRPVTVMQQALNDVLFSSFNLSANSGDSASFAGTMNFASFTQTLWPMLAGGGRGGPVSVGYDIVNGKRIAGTLASNVAGFGNGNLDGSAAPIPEPQTWAMMLAGIIGLLGVARRRHAAA